MQILQRSGGVFLTFVCGQYFETVLWEFDFVWCKIDYYVWKNNTLSIKCDYQICSILPLFLIKLFQNTKLNQRSAWTSASRVPEGLRFKSNSVQTLGVKRPPLPPPPTQKQAFVKWSSPNIYIFLIFGRKKFRVFSECFFYGKKIVVRRIIINSCKKVYAYFIVIRLLKWNVFSFISLKYECF